MNVCFLLGSGASVPAGFPTVAQITQSLNGDSEQSGLSAADAAALSVDGRKLLRWLEVQIKRRYTSDSNRAVQYENLYFLAKQVSEDLLDDYDNPALRPFVESAIEQVLPRSSGRPGNAYEELSQLTKYFVTHIRRCVAALLRHEPSQLNHLDFVAEAIEEISHPKPTLFTLNHDTLLEKMLKCEGLKFIDGFGQEANTVGVHEWQSGQFFAQTDVIRVLKLHGGIDWFRLRPHGVQTHEEDYVGVLTPKYSTAARDSRGRSHDLMDDSLPIFMIGSWDKLAGYTDPVYLEIYYAAVAALKNAELLVVVGYGFGDKGINKLITDWMCRSVSHRIVVVDRHADELWRHALGAIVSKWQTWFDKKRLFPLRVDLQESKISWSIIQNTVKRERATSGPGD
jgi:hypothetical protein